MALDDLGSGSGSGGSNSNSSSSNGKLVNVGQVPQFLIQQLKSQLSRIDNQRVNLVKSLIEIEDYSTAIRLIEKLPQWFLAYNSDIAAAICKALNRNFIDKMYQKINLLSKYLKDKYVKSNSKTNHFVQNKLKQQQQQIADEEMNNNNNSQESHDQLLNDFLDRILPILNALGPGISYDMTLFTKLIRICTAFMDMKKLSSANSFQHSTNEQEKDGSPGPMQENGEESSNFDNLRKESIDQNMKCLSDAELRFYNSIYSIINEVFMPSLSMLSSNPCVSMELWNILKLFPYEFR